MSATCFLLLGSNVADRLAKLRRAKKSLAALRGCSLLASSRVYETAPVGPSDRPYLNAVVAVRCERTPMGLLAECKRLEAEAGRRPSRRWAARPLDIDILTFGSLRLRTRWLTVPHPAIGGRPFVLAPLKDVAPGLALGPGRTVASRLRELNPPTTIVRLYRDGL
jgi:2-amino-4-hydroxy-6-hydroxymethyldihydropteridine diphosphokinase